MHQTGLVQVSGCQFLHLPLHVADFWLFCCFSRLQWNGCRSNPVTFVNLIDLCYNQLTFPIDAFLALVLDGPATAFYE